MNKVYKSIWNHETRSWTAVSEIKTIRRKTSRTKNLVTASLTAMALGLLAGSAQAAPARNWHETVWGVDGEVRLHRSLDEGQSQIASREKEAVFSSTSIEGIKKAFAFGKTGPAKTYSNTNSHTLQIGSEPNQVVQLDLPNHRNFGDFEAGYFATGYFLDDESLYASNLFEQSFGFNQLLVTATGTITVAQGATVDLGIHGLNDDDAGDNAFHQNIYNGNEVVATGIYTIGREAVTDELNRLGNTFGADDSRIVDSLFGKNANGYQAAGDVVYVNDSDFGQRGIYTTTILSEIQLLSALPLSLTENNQTLAARISEATDATGTLRFVNKAQGQSQVALTHNQNRYSFTEVGQGVTLGFKEGALGLSSVTLAGSDANLVAESGAQETVSGLYTDANKHEITLPNGSEIIIAGNHPTYGNEIGASTVLTGNGTLTVKGEANAQKATTLSVQNAQSIGNFGGALLLDGLAAATVEGDAVFNAGTVKGTIAGNALPSLTLKTETHVGSYSDNGAAHKGVDFSSYNGHILLDGEHQLTVHGNAGSNGDIWFSGTEGAILISQGSQIVLDGSQGYFNWDVQSQDGKATGFMSLVNGAVLTVDGTHSGDLSGISRYVLNQGTTLALQEDAFSRLAQTSQVVGLGNLNLQGLQAVDTASGKNALDLGDVAGNADYFAGTVNLVNSTLTVNKNAAYALNLDGESKAIFAATSPLELKDRENKYKGIDFADGATVDLSGMTDMKDKPLLIVDSLTSIGTEGSDVLKITLNEQLLNIAVQEVDLLAQDEGWNRLIVQTVNAPTITKDNILFSLDGENQALASRDVTIADGVTGFYVIDSLVGDAFTDKTGVGLGYKLLDLTVDQNKSVALTGTTDAITGANADLNVFLHGAGTIVVNNNVTINALDIEDATNQSYQEQFGANIDQSNFSGTYSVTEGAALTLTGLGETHAAAELAQNATLTLESNQNLRINNGGEGAVVAVGSETNDAVQLTLEGESLLEAGTALKGSGNAQILIANKTDAKSLLHLKGAQAALKDYLGTIELTSEADGLGATLRLDDNSQTTLNLDRIKGGAQHTLIDLASGLYEITGQAFEGAWNVAKDAVLELSKWTQDAQDAPVKFANTLTGAGVVALTNGSQVAMQTGASGFAGTWMLADNTATRLVIDNETAPSLNADASFVIGTGNTLELAGWIDNGNPRVFDNQVSGTDTGSGTVALTNESQVSLGAIASGFGGLWDLSTSTTSETLVANAFRNQNTVQILNTEATVALGNGDTLDIKNGTNPTQWAALASDVNANQTDVKTGLFKVSEGRVEVLAGTAINVAQTAVTDGASLAVNGMAQLGSDITIADASLLKVNVAAEDISTPEGQTQTTFTLTDRTIAGAGELLLNLNGSQLLFGDTEADNASLLKNFTGQITIANGTYVFSTADRDMRDSSNFALSANAVFKVTGTDTADKLGSFGWVYTDEFNDDTDKVGMLDLSDFVYSEGKKPAMEVGTLQLDSNGTIQLNMQDWVYGQLDSTSSAQPSMGNLLSLDDGSSDNFIITANDIIGEGDVILVDSSGEAVGQLGTPQVLYDTDGNEIADAIWGWGADVIKDGDQKGVAIGYQVLGIDLHNANAGGALIFAPASANGNGAEFLGYIQGAGKIDVMASDQGNTVQLTHVTSSRMINTFRGLVTVKEGANLVTQGFNVLSGHGTTTENVVELVLEDGTNFTSKAVDMSANARERIALTTQGSSVITLNNSTLTLLGRDEVYGTIDGKTIGTVSSISGGTYFVGTGNSFVVAEGKVQLKDASFTLGKSENVTFQLMDDGLFALEGTGDFSLSGFASIGEGTGGTILLAHDADHTAGNTTVTAGDLLHFKGTIDIAANHTLKADVTEAAGQKADLTNASLNLSTETSRLELTGNVKAAGIKTVEGSQINFGQIKVGEAATTGSLTVSKEDQTVAVGTQFEVDFSDRDIGSDSVLFIDDGLHVELVNGLDSSQKIDNNWKLTVTGIESGPLTGAVLNADNDSIGTATYWLEEAICFNNDAGSLGFHYALSALELTGDLVLNAVDAATDAAKTLSAIVTASNAEGANGGITIASSTDADRVNQVILDGEGQNFYRFLNVGENANAVLADVQTITGTGGVVEGLLSQATENTAPAQLVITDNGDLTFKGQAQRELTSGVKLAGGTLILEGIDNRADTAYGDLLSPGGLSISGTGNTLALRDTLGTIAYGTLDFEDGSALTLTVAGTSDALLAGTSDITGALSATVEKDATLRFNIADATVADWSHLGHLEEGDGTIVVSGTGDNKSKLNLYYGSGAADFAFNGALTLDNVEIDFAEKAKAEGESNVNSDVLKTTSVSLVNSVAHTSTAVTSSGLYLKDSQLNFKENGPTGIGTQADGLITMTDGAQFTADAGVTIGLDFAQFGEDLKAQLTGTEPDQTVNASVLDAYHEALIAEKNEKFLQLVAGEVSGLQSAVIVDSNGAQLAETSKISVLDGNTLAAEIGYGVTLVAGSTVDDKTYDAWVSHGVREVRLMQSTVLNAEALQKQESAVYDGTQFEIADALTSGTDNIDIEIAGAVPIVLSNSGNDISGNTTVADNATLVLAASNALGGATDQTETVKRYTKKLTIKDTAKVLLESAVENVGISQQIGSLDLQQGGTLDLDGSGIVRVMDAQAGSVAGQLVGDKDTVLRIEASQAAFTVTDTADLSTMKGTLDLAADATMTVNADTKAQEMSNATVTGGTIVKMGAETLNLSYAGISRDATVTRSGETQQTSLDLQEGSVHIAGWNNNTLSLRSLNLAAGADPLYLTGDLRTSEGFTASGSRVYVGDAQFKGSFNNYRIEGGFEGKTTFVHNAWLAENQSYADHLTIDGGVTSDSQVNLLVQDRAPEGQTTFEKVTLLTVDTGKDVSEDFAKLDSQSYSNGGFELALGTELREDEHGNSFRDFYLAPMGINGKPTTDASQVVIDARVGALAGFASTVDMFDLSIHDRQGTRPWINPVTGEERMTSLWMRQTMSRETMGDNSGQFASENDENVTMIGADLIQFSQGKDGLVFAGVMAGFGESDFKSDSRFSGRQGRAQTDGWMVGAYGGWHGLGDDGHRTGPYVDGWIQYANFSSDITRSGIGKLKAKADGLSASLEAGWIVKVADFGMDDGLTRAALYVEPHAKASWWGAKFDAIDGHDIEFLGENNVTTRLGARVTLEASGKRNFSPFVEGNWVHNTQEAGVKWSDVSSRVSGMKDQAEVKAGVETYFSDNLSGYAQFRMNWGADGYDYKEGSLGLKYRF